MGEWPMSGEVATYTSEGKQLRAANQTHGPNLIFFQGHNACFTKCDLKPSLGSLFPFTWSFSRDRGVCQRLNSDVKLNSTNSPS